MHFFFILLNLHRSLFFLRTSLTTGRPWGHRAASRLCPHHLETQQKWWRIPHHQLHHWETWDLEDLLGSRGSCAWSGDLCGDHVPAGGNIVQHPCDGGERCWPVGTYRAGRGYCAQEPLQWVDGWICFLCFCFSHTSLPLAENSGCSCRVNQAVTAQCCLVFPVVYFFLVGS